MLQTAGSASLLNTLFASTSQRHRDLPFPNAARPPRGQPRPLPPHAPAGEEPAPAAAAPGSAAATDGQRGWRRGLCTAPLLPSAHIPGKAPRTAGVQQPRGFRTLGHLLQQFITFQLIPIVSCTRSVPAHSGSPRGFTDPAPGLPAPGGEQLLSGSSPARREKHQCHSVMPRELDACTHPHHT